MANFSRLSTSWVEWAASWGSSVDAAHTAPTDYQARSVADIGRYWQQAPIGGWRRFHGFSCGHFPRDGGDSQNQ